MTKRILCALVALAGTAATVLAADEIKGDGYLAPAVDGNIDWLTIVFFVVALAAMAVVAFKTSGRTHLD
jgi:hypothetical protein